MCSSSATCFFSFSFSKSLQLCECCSVREAWQGVLLLAPREADARRHRRDSFHNSFSLFFSPGPFLPFPPIPPSETTPPGSRCVRVDFQKKGQLLLRILTS